MHIPSQTIAASVLMRFVTIETLVVTDRTRHLNASSARDVQVSGPVSYDRSSYRNSVDGLDGLHGLISHDGSNGSTYRF